MAWRMLIVADPSFMAFDLGAGSGRALLGRLEDGRLRLRDVARFPNGMLSIHGSLYWNVYRLFEEMKNSLKACSLEGNPDPVSLGVDTWGVDFSLLDRNGRILGLPFAYRDARTEGAMEGFFERMPKGQVYALTGNQFLRFNSLFQLFAMERDVSPQLDIAADLLFMPDLFNYLLTGEKKTEFTYATTSQLFNPRKNGWEKALFDALRIPMGLMQDIVPPGTVIGDLCESVRMESGVGRLRVVAGATHDTGSAVAAVPAEGEDWAYISSGTWSLAGIETTEPIIDENALKLNFTNEGGVEGRFRFLRNVMGLWLVQECRRAWENERAFDYEALTGMAASAEPFLAFIDPDQEIFMNPPDMPETVRRVCRDSNQPSPETPAQIVRIILESLALKYRLVFDRLREISPKPIRRIHVIGGGVKNRLLCQFTANATGLPVIAGPVEATAAGNLMMQALALGYVGSLDEIRRVIRRSFDLEAYEPQETGAWEDAYGRFLEIVES